MHNAARILVALTLALSPLACTATVIGGGGGTGADSTADAPPVTNPSGGNPSGGNPSGGNPTPVTPTALAYGNTTLDNACNTATGGSSTTTTSTSSGTVTTNTLFLTVGAPAPTCACPFSDVGSCGGWQVTIGLSPDQQQAGTVIDLNNNTNANFGETEPADASGQCQGGGGGTLLGGGTLEIVSIDDTQVVFTLSGTQPISGFSGPLIAGGDANGTYTALRCPGN